MTWNSLSTHLDGFRFSFTCIHCESFNVSILSQKRISMDDSVFISILWYFYLECLSFLSNFLTLVMVHGTIWQEFSEICMFQKRRVNQPWPAHTLPELHRGSSATSPRQPGAVLGDQCEQDSTAQLVTGCATVTQVHQCWRCREHPHLDMLLLE